MTAESEAQDATPDADDRVKVVQQSPYVQLTTGEGSAEFPTAVLIAQVEPGTPGAVRIGFQGGGAAVVDAKDFAEFAAEARKLVE